MARRRFGRRIRTAARRSVSYVRQSYAAKRRKTSSGQNPLMNVVLPAATYGAVRAPIKNMIMPYVPNLLGDNTDEVVMGFAGYMLMKHTTGFMHDFGRAALTVESASLGNNLIAPMIQSTVSSVGNSASSGIYNA